ncbi:MAG TPA: rhomboid family intramembrane serine protease [Parafilimonas sp.]|nr:rhomboid family intramembrane serine protease [Parafilimonas sp.]
MSVREQNSRKKILIGQDNNALTWLIILNAVVYVSVLFIKVIFDLTYDHSELIYSNIDSWVALPANGYEFLKRPWTIITYMFAHNSFLYFISSLLWLWGFGYILQDLAGNNKLFPLYLYGGFFGGIFFLVIANLIPSIHANAAAYSLMGAGAPVMSIAIATTFLAPEYRIFPRLNGGIPLWVLMLLFVTIELSTIGSGNIAVAGSHIAGGLTGFLFVYQLKRGRDMGSWLSRVADWVNNLFNPEKKHEKKELYYRTTRKPYEKSHHFSQQKLDEILDKINEQGYHFLTEEEKDFLKKASKENF